MSYSKHEKDIFNARLDGVIADSDLNVCYLDKGKDINLVFWLYLILFGLILNTISLLIFG